MDERKIFDPKWPPENPKTEAGIGRFVIAWGVLEREIDMAIGDIYRLDPALTGSITANLGTKAKIEIFQSAVHIEARGFFKKGNIVGDVDTLVSDTSTASNEHRNFLAHGQPVTVLLDKEENWFVKWVARKGGLRGRMGRLTPVLMEKALTETHELVKRWNDMRKRLAPHIEAMNAVDQL